MWLFVFGMGTVVAFHNSKWAVCVIEGTPNGRDLERWFVLSGREPQHEPQLAVGVFV